MKVLVVGGSGFIGKYCIDDFLAHGHDVTNIDLMKYIPDKNGERYHYYKRDAKRAFPIEGQDVLINFAALLGGIKYFHKYPATLMAENELICASVFNQALKAYQSKNLKRVIQLSSSMVFENTSIYPTSEEDLVNTPSPSSVYGFQKLAAEYWCKAFNEEYSLPYVIVRPFNAVGIGEDPTADSHVIPQLAYKILKGQNPLEIIGKGNQIRVYTHASDIASAIRLIVEDPTIVNMDFNISNEANEISVLELAKSLWNRIQSDKEFRYVELPDLKYDVQKRVGSSKKAQILLKWQPKVSLPAALDEVVKDMEKWVE